MAAKFVAKAIRGDRSIPSESKQPQLAAPAWTRCKRYALNAVSNTTDNQMARRLGNRTRAKAAQTSKVRTVPSCSGRASAKGMCPRAGTGSTTLLYTAS